ncbi:MAG: O-antigen ligase family protein [Candidatus Paceibacteria bacterium]
MKYLERAYPWLLVAPAILPVIIWDGLIYPYLVPKTLLFYAISLIALAAFGILAAHGRTFYYARLRQWETWIPGALLALAYSTSFIGVDFYRSFWSIFARGDGLLMLTCVVASFYLIVLYADKKFFDLLLRAIALVASFVAIYGIGEWLMGGGRIGSLLGNAAFFAGYLGIAFFATIVAAQSLSREWRRAAYMGAALQVIAIILTATRGTMLALGIALIVFLSYRAFAKTPPASKKDGALQAARPSLTPSFFDAGSVWARVILVAIVLLGGAFFAFRSELATVPFGPIARIASISATEGDVASRLFIWKNMVGEIAKSPWVGVGAEHIDALFNRFYDPTQISEQWFDRSHNAFLDYAAQYGIGGLLLYLALIAAFITSAARFARHGSRPVAGFFVLLAITYAVQNFFVFDTISSFWLLLALLAAFIALSLEGVSREAFPLPAWSRYVSWIVALALVAFLVPVSFRPAIAAYDLAQAYKYQLYSPTSANTYDPSREISYLSHGFALGTYGDLEYGYSAYDIYANTQTNVLTGAARADAYQAALSVLTVSFDRYPYDARTALYLAQVLSIAPPGVTVDQDLLSSALERAIRLSPKRSQSWYIVVNLAINRANAYPPKSAERIAGYAAAQDILAKYIAMVPNLSAPYYIAAQLGLAEGDTTAAAAAAAKGKAVYQSDLETAKRAAIYYENVLDLTNAAFFLGEVVRLDPNNTAAKSDLDKIQTYERAKQ